MDVSKYPIYCKGLVLLPTSKSDTLYGHMLFSLNIKPPNVPKSIVNLKLNNTNTYTIPPSIPNDIASAECSVLEHWYN